jgi:hypothetical protein
MGLLEKAGKMQTDAPAATKEKKAEKPQKAAKPKKAPRKARKPRKAKPVVDDLDEFEVEERVARTMPDEFILASGKARFARSLIDFIVTYGWMVPIVGMTAYGTYFDPTYFIAIGGLITLFNLIVMPIMTHRTVGNYASLTSYITSKGNPPFFLHQTFKGLTWLFLLVGAFLIASAYAPLSGWNTVNLGIGFAIFAIPLTDWIVSKIRHETKQGLWDSMFFAYMVKHARTGEEAEGGFFGRLESSGDWLKDKGWLGSEESED